MRIITYILSISLVLFSWATHAQTSTFSQFYLNPTSVNSGFTGIEPYVDISLGYKQLWRDFDQGDNAMFLAIDKSFGQIPATVYKNNSLRVSDPSRYNQVDRNKRLKRKHGVGASVLSNAVGPLKELNATLRYAYHMPVTLNWKLSFGTSLGYFQSRIDFSKYTVRDQSDEFYQMLVSSGERQQGYHVDFGTLMYNQRWMIGLSMSNMINESLGDENLLSLTPQENYHLFISNNIDLSKSLELNTNILVTHDPLTDIYWMSSSRVRYNNKLVLGVGFDSNKRLSGHMGVKLTDNVTANYSYDYFVGDLSSFSVVNHEILINFNILNPYKLTERVW